LEAWPAAPSGAANFRRQGRAVGNTRVHLVGHETGFAKACNVGVA
jgi:hypothetical protein